MFLPQAPESEFDGKRLRKSVMRKTVDYNSSIVAMLEARVWQRDERDRNSLQADICYASEVMPPQMYSDNPINAVVTKFVRTSTNKQKVGLVYNAELTDFTIFSHPTFIKKMLNWQISPFSLIFDKKNAEFTGSAYCILLNCS